MVARLACVAGADVPSLACARSGRICRWVAASGGDVGQWSQQQRTKKGPGCLNAGWWVMGDGRCSGSCVCYGADDLEVDMERQQRARVLRCCSVERWIIGSGCSCSLLVVRLFAVRCSLFRLECFVGRSVRRLLGCAVQEQVQVQVKSK